MNMSDAARSLWHAAEPYHAIVYFSPQAKPTYAALGLKGGWMGYFASRSAALGAVPADVVVAAFYGFAPRMVHRALPDAWDYTTPAAAAAARLRVMDAAVGPLFGPGDRAALGDTLALARTAVAAADASGRVLFAAHRSLPWPEPAHLALWHAASCLREHRGDGHVAVLLAEGIDGCESHVIAVAAGAVPEGQREYRGWTEQEWEQARQRLRERGIVDSDGRLTATGSALRAHVESRTDALAAAALAALTDAQVEQLVDGFAAVTARTATALPYPNAVGVPEPGA